MTDAHIVLLLQLLYAGADVHPLLRSGLTYSQISRLIREAIDRGLIEEKEKAFVLTKPGLNLMRKGGKASSAKKDGGWISPYDQDRIPKLKIYDIYLPAKKPLK